MDHTHVHARTRCTARAHTQAHAHARAPVCDQPVGGPQPTVVSPCTPGFRLVGPARPRAGLRSQPAGRAGAGAERWPHGRGRDGRKERFISSLRVYYKRSDPNGVNTTDAFSQWRRRKAGRWQVSRSPPTGLIPERGAKAPGVQNRRAPATAHAASETAERTHTTRPRSCTPCRWAGGPWRVPAGATGPRRCLGPCRPKGVVPSWSRAPSPSDPQPFLSWTSYLTSHTEGGLSPSREKAGWAEPGGQPLGHKTHPHKSLGLLSLSFLPAGQVTDGCGSRRMRDKQTPTPHTGLHRVVHLGSKSLGLE